MYFEIFKNGKLTKRGDEILNELSWDIELMEVPQMDLTLPIEYSEYIGGREEIKIHANDKIFWGIVVDHDENKEDEILEVKLNHVVHEWTYRLISINNAIKDKKVNIIYKGSETKSAGDVSITANPFNMFVKEVGKITDAQIISRAGAQAWKSNGDKVSISVDKSKLQKKAGDYDVTFTAGQAKVTVKATVKENNSKDKDSSSSSTDASVIDNLSDIYADTNFAYPGWELNFEGDAGNREIDYVYSKQNKLEALTQTCELTEDLFWRVDFSGEKRIDIGVFGEKKPYIISKKAPGKTNIQIIGDPTVDHDYENVFNVATVYSQKSDNGMSSLTLREVYNDPSLQTEGFPVIILRSNVNNERNYEKYSTQYPILASNNELEFAVLCEESIALEGGNIIEEALEFNDLGSFKTDGEKITDTDRIKAATTAYTEAKRKLKQAMRSKSVEPPTTPIPVDVKVGDKVRFIYDNSIFKLEACSNYEKKILTMNDWFYVTHIDYGINTGGVEVDTVKLEKRLKIDRETKDTRT